MRFHAKFGKDRHYVFPFRAGPQPVVTSDFLSPVPLELAIEWFYRVAEFQLTARFFIDPMTSETGSSEYVRTVNLARPAHPIHGERGLLFPGIEADLHLETARPGPWNVWTWSGGESLGEDDVFNSSALGASLALFYDGYGTPTNTLGTIPEGFVSPSIRLRFAISYDDGTEATLAVDTAPTPYSDLGPEAQPPMQIGFFGELDGISFTGIASDDTGGSPNDTLLKASPEITITPVSWYPYVGSDGLPIWSSVTGAKLRDPRTRVV